MSYILERLDELLQLTRDAVNASDLSDKASVTVTDDGRRVPIAASLRAGAIVIYPMPEEQWPAPYTAKLTWTIGIVATAETPRKAAARIHALKDLLLSAGVIRWPDTGAPTDFQLPDQSAVPGYAISHLEQHDRRTS